MLGRRGLYPPLGGTIRQRVADPERPHEARAYDLGDGGGKTIAGNRLDAMLWTMFHGDGETSLLDIARRTGLPVSALAEAAAVLQEHGLLEPAADDRA
jgi:aminopeptidase-like protein